MNPQALLAILLVLAAVRDWHGRPIRRRPEAAAVVAKAAGETGAPEVFAAYLDVLAAHESGYDPSARGDHRNGVAKSCGMFQTPCSETPGFERCDGGDDCRHGWRFEGGRGVALAQARLAIRILLGRAMVTCPEHAVWAYASGHCAPSRVALAYEAEAGAEARVIKQAEMLP